MMLVAIRFPQNILNDSLVILRCRYANTICHLYKVGQTFQIITLYLLLMCVYVLGCDSDLHSLFSLMVRINLRLSSTLKMCNSKILDNRSHKAPLVIQQQAERSDFIRLSEGSHLIRITVYPCGSVAETLIEPTCRL